MYDVACQATGVRAVDYLTCLQYLESLGPALLNSRQSEVVLIPNSSLDILATIAYKSNTVVA